MGKIGKYKMTKSNFSRIYIRDNYFKLNKREIINNLIKETGLKRETIESIYSEMELDVKVTISNEVRNSIRLQKDVLTYKGRVRRFFQFDDRNIYKRHSQ